ncbi:MAG: hypothetical protein ISR65_18790 [Bacteriovoracaceae bacterium]|nr:hypothetical protein [Bacteriovoracaceae bacterium]
MKISWILFCLLVLSSANVSAMTCRIQGKAAEARTTLYNAYLKNQSYKTQVANWWQCYRKAIKISKRYSSIVRLSTKIEYYGWVFFEWKVDNSALDIFKSSGSVTKYTDSCLRPNFVTRGNAAYKRNCTLIDL